MSEPKDNGIGLYSTWYNDKFIREKLKQKQTELARREELGEIENVKEWHARAQRRFQAAFDRLSDETKRSYQSSARHFGKYMGLKRGESKVSAIVARLIMLSYIEASTLVEEYVHWMQEEQDLAPNTINVRLAALRWFVDTARRVGWVEWKLDVKSVKAENIKDTSGPSDAEFRRILRVINRAEGKASIRNKLMVYMLAFMGMRISSVISLNYENINFKQRTFKVRWKGKGKIYIPRPAGPAVMSVLKEWLQVRGYHDGPIFISLDRGKKGSGRLTIRSARKIIRNIGAEASTKKILGPHAFRHFHTTENLEATDGNIHKVQQSTGHTDPRMVARYDDKRKDEARSVTEEMEKRWLGSLDDTEESDEATLEAEQEEEIYRIDPNDEDLADVVTAIDAVDNAVTYVRYSTGMESVDELLGGTDDAGYGLVRGSIVLIGGYPGIGKSTLARQICYNVVENNPGEKVLYASGEETTDQIGEALDRLDSKHQNFLLLAERSIDKICRAAQKLRVCTLVVDSVGTVTLDSVDKRPGSVTQVKAVGQYLMDWTKGIDEEPGTDITVIIISHVDKKGQIAGPKVLEHTVDAVFVFDGEKRQRMRTLGCEGKNRFGDSTKVAFFDMTENGLVEVIPPDDDDDDEDDDDDDLGFDEDN